MALIAWACVPVWQSSTYAAAPDNASHVLPATLTERVVSRLTGGDVVGATTMLGLLEPLLRVSGSGDAVDRVRLRLRAAAGSHDVIDEVLRASLRAGQAGPWLIAEAARGLGPTSPMVSGLLTSMIPRDSEAGRQARLELAKLYGSHDLVGHGVETLASILGKPQQRLRGVPRRLVASLAPQKTVAAEAERGWLLYDLHASKSARQAFGGAETLAAKNPKNSDGDRDALCWAWIGSARANFSQRDWPAAHRGLGKALGEPACANNPELPEAMVRMARNAFVQKDRLSLIRAVAWLSKHAPQWSAQHGVAALPVLMDAKGGDLRRLARRIRKKLGDRRWFDPVGDAAMEAFLSLHSKRRYGAAAKLLTPLADGDYQHWRPGLWGQLDYWAARATWEDGDKGSALARWERLVRRYPQSWYGLLAAERLRAEAPERFATIEAELLQTLASRELPVRRSQTSDLEKWGLSDALAHELWTAGVFAAPSEAAEASRRLTALGLPSRATRLAQRAMKLGDPGAIETDPHGLWRAAWPTPFETSLGRAVAVTEADPWFVWGVMRTESLFTPTVVSRAGARGLLQLMPGTAKWLRRKLDDPRLGSGDTFDPVDNILLGSIFLKRLGRTYDGSKPLMLAAYNAGPGRLKKYVRTLVRKRRVPDAALFVETLPWNEAKHYVRSVVTNWATYRLLYDCQCMSRVAEVLPAEYLDGLAQQKKTRKKKRKRKRRNRRR